MVSEHYLENYPSHGFHISHAGLAFGEDKTPIGFGFTRSTVNVTRVSFVKQKKFPLIILRNN